MKERERIKKEATIRATVKFKARETEKIERWNRYKRRFYEMEREVRNVKAETETGDRKKEQKLT
jgi:hypothetical protein